MPTDPQQFPQNAVIRKVNPTSLLGIVTKFDVSEGYRDRDQIENETGILSNILGVDMSLKGDVEIVLEANANFPQDLTTFVVNIANAQPNYSTFANGNVLTLLINGEIKPGGNNGRAAKFSFPVIKTATMPTAGPG